MGYRNKAIGATKMGSDAPNAVLLEKIIAHRPKNGQKRSKKRSRNARGTL
jgi:hypothetical protein